ncbi:hypothetical protein HanRHA438_Chr05g0242071 [Helianthus annuus]|nr:hypothetical protein HanRHA438_Chr05g0242071 [Helianthus annuus]
MNNQIKEKETTRTVLIAPDTLPVETQWCNRSLVGEVKEFHSLENLQTLLSELDIPEVDAKYLGGMSILLPFGTKEAAEDFLVNKKESWEKKFETLSEWDGKYTPEERLAWLIISGVPARLWDGATFDLIGNSYGKVVVPSKASITDDSLTHCKVSIVSRLAKKIEERVQIRWKDQSFMVDVCEDPARWSPGHISPEAGNPTVTAGSGRIGLDKHEASDNVWTHSSRLVKDKQSSLGPKGFSWWYPRLLQALGPIQSQ